MQKLVLGMIAPLSLASPALLEHLLRSICIQNASRTASGRPRPLNRSVREQSASLTRTSARMDQTLAQMHARHASLLAEEAELGFDALSLEDIQAKHADLVGRTAALNDSLSELQRTTTHSHDRLVAMQKTAMARIITRFKSGGSNRNVKKASHSLLAAEAAEGHARSHYDAHSVALQHADARLRDLRRRGERHEEIQGELDRLYVEIFEREGPENEEEQASRAEHQAAIQAVTDSEEDVRINEACFKEIAEARKALSTAQNKTHAAMAVPSSNSRADAMKRKHLIVAQEECFNAVASFIRAKDLLPSVKGLSQKDIVERTIFKNILMDADLRDNATFRDRIYTQNISVHWALSDATEQEHKQAHRLKVSRLKLEVARERVETTRAQLAAVRRRIVIDAAQAPPALSPSAGVEAPPSYPTGAAREEAAPAPPRY